VLRELRKPGTELLDGNLTVLGINFGRDTRYLEIFRRFSQSLQENSGVTPRVGHDLLLIDHFQFISHPIIASYIKQTLVGKPEGKRPLGRPRRRWVDNIKMDLREIGWDGVDWVDLAQDRDQWRALVNTVMNLRIP
jgi:hypothetical protein